MKAVLAGSHDEQGSSTLEIIIALAVFTMGLSSVILVTFGNQIISAEGPVMSTALSQATGMIEKARASSRFDFPTVISSASTEDIYTRTFTVTDTTPCQKNVTSRVDWATDPSRPATIALSSTVNDVFGSIFGNDWGAECGSIAHGAWASPLVFAQLKQISGEQVPTGIDIKEGHAYITSGGGTSAKNDFTVVDVSGPTPTVASSLDTGTGLKAVDVAHQYAYVANQDSTYPVQIIDLSNGTYWSLQLPTSAAQGLSVYYYHARLYIGTQYTISKNIHEFQIYDVTDPLHPVHISDADVGYNVNAIVVRGTTAYLAVGSASGDPNDLFMFDLTNLTIPPKKFSLSDKGCKSLFLANDTLFVGCFKSATAPDFFVLNASDPSHVLQSTRIGFDVNGIRVSGKYAFLATSDKNLSFRAWDISVSPMTQVGSLKIPKSTKGSPGLDYESNSVYLLDGSTASTSLAIIKTP